METNTNETTERQAAAQKVAAARAEAEGVQAEKRTRQPRKPKDAPKTEPEKQDAGVTFIVQADALRPAITSFLQIVADLSHTASPSKEEAASISDGLAIGLRNTRLGVNPKTAPWVPLMLAVSLYALPRAMEALIHYAERKQAAEVAAEPSFRAEGDGSPALAAGSVVAGEEAGRVTAQGLRG